MERVSTELNESSNMIWRGDGIDEEWSRRGDGEKDLRQDSWDYMDDEVPVGRRGERGDVRESLVDGDHGSVSAGENESLRLSSGKGDEGGVEDGSSNGGSAVERGGGERSGEDVVEHDLSDERSVTADVGGESSEGLEMCDESARRRWAGERSDSPRW